MLTKNNSIYITDGNALPVSAIMGAAVCLIGVCLFMSTFIRAIALTIRMLRVSFCVREQYTYFIENYRSNYTILAILTACLIVIFVLTSYFRVDARTSRNPMCEYCEKSVPCFVVSRKLNLYIISLMHSDRLYFFSKSSCSSGTSL